VSTIDNGYIIISFISFSAYEAQTSSLEHLNSLSLLCTMLVLRSAKYKQWKGFSCSINEKSSPSEPCQIEAQNNKRSQKRPRVYHEFASAGNISQSEDVRLREKVIAQYITAWMRDNTVLNQQRYFRICYILSCCYGNPTTIPVF
jgi:hypothetical protein